MIRCHACGAANPDTKQIDDGIGPYEYFGATGVHHNWVDVTECCEADLSDLEPHEALRKCGRITYRLPAGEVTETPTQFMYPHVPDAMLREAVAAWLAGKDYAELFAAACEKGFEDAVEYLDALEELENE